MRGDLHKIYQGIRFVFNPFSFIIIVLKHNLSFFCQVFNGCHNQKLTIRIFDKYVAHLLVLIFDKPQLYNSKTKSKIPKSGSTSFSFFFFIKKLLKTKNCQNDEKKTGKLSRTLALIISSANLLFTSKINKTS